MAGSDAGLRSAGITVKGHPASPEQLRNITTVLQEADALEAQGKKVTELVRLAAMVAGIGESRFLASAVDGKTGTHKGVLQSNQIDPKDVKAQAHYFFVGGRSFRAGGVIGYHQDNPDATAGQIAQAVEISDGTAAYYDSWRDEGRAILAAYQGGSLQTAIGGTPDRAYIKAYEFTYSPVDTVWERARQLCDELVIRLFAIGNVAYIATDTTLITQRSAVTFEEGADGVESVRWSRGYDQALDQVTVQARLGGGNKPVQIAPGQTALVAGEAFIDPSQRWICDSFERDLLNADAPATIILDRAVAPKPEPRSTVVTVPGTPGVIEGPAAPETLGRVTVKPGANRVDQTTHKVVDIQKVVLEFLALVAGQTSEDISVTCGTHHNKLSTSGFESDHWTGYAADLDVGGDARTSAAARSKGNNIATAALTVLGVEDARKKAESGWCDFGPADAVHWRGYRVQIGWLTLVGGDHFDHVHIGLKKL